METMTAVVTTIEASGQTVDTLLYSWICRPCKTGGHHTSDEARRRVAREHVSGKRHQGSATLAEHDPITGS